MIDEKDMKEITEQLAKQDAPAEQPATNLRDKQDFVELVVNMVSKKMEVLNSNRDFKKLAPQTEDSKAVRDVKFKHLVKSILYNDAVTYGKTCGYFGETREFSTTDASGGYSIPPDVRTDIIADVIASGVARRNANVIPTQSDSVQLNGLLTSVAAAWGTEATAASGTSGTQTAPSMTVGKIIAILGPFSNEILSDAAPGFYQQWVNEIGSSIGQLEDYTAFLGDGTATYNSVTGIMAGTAGGQSAVTLTTTDVQASVDLANKLADVISTVPAGMRVGAKWYFHRSLEGTLWKTRTGTGEQILPMGNFVSDALGSGRLLGYPYELVDVLPDVSTVATGTAFAAFGNLGKSLHIADRQQMTMFVGREGTVDAKSMFAADQMGVRVTERLGMVVYVPRFTKFGGTNNVDRKGLVILKTA